MENSVPFFHNDSLSAMEATTAHGQRRKSRGRQKIEIKKVEQESSRYVTFSKRKNGIFKKATELSALCGADVAVILFSEHGKVFTCGNPDGADKIIDRYLSGTEEVEVEDGPFLPDSNPIEQELEHLDALRRLEETKQALKMVETQRNAMNSEFWWNLSIENMEKEELEVYKKSLQELKNNVMQRIDTMASYNASSESRIISQFIDQSGDWSNSNTSNALYSYSGLNSEFFDYSNNEAHF